MRRYLETIGFRRRLWEIGLKEASMRRLCELGGENIKEKVMGTWSSENI